ncbi:hypothetical protein V6N13_031321 [Hibiscus sabdariffa]|uniref:Pectinesterase inhibitor domain-containing protein n=1 Tax=Hibiscus sabdariffa TaxID=183260 RepID=A0ABR2CKP9_9ROSI
MANSCKFNACFLLLTLVASSIFTNPALCDEATQALIDKICRQMEEYAFCNDTFNRNLKGSTADIAALTRIAIEQTLSASKDTHDFVVGLLDKTTDLAEKNALTVCENAYFIVTDCFKQASAAFAQKDYDSMLKVEHQAPRA